MSGRTGHGREDIPRDKEPARYGEDYYQWTREQAALLRSGRLQDIDCMNIAEEIEALGKSDYRALESDLAVIVCHMLNWDFLPDRRSRSWQLTIREHRRRVAHWLEDSPSLKVRLPDALLEAYDDGRDRALAETELPDDGLPTMSPYTWTDMMERSFVFEV